MTMTVSKEGDETVLALEGELDVYTAARLRERLVDLIHGVRPNIVVDLAGVQFADSTGIGTLVLGVRRARGAGGDVVLRAPNPALRRSIEIMGLQEVLSIRDPR